MKNENIKDTWRFAIAETMLKNGGSCSLSVLYAALGATDENQRGTIRRICQNNFGRVRRGVWGIAAVDRLPLAELHPELARSVEVEDKINKAAFEDLNPNGATSLEI